jgi:hypothetical protein
MADFFIREIGRMLQMLSSLSSAQQAVATNIFNTGWARDTDTLEPEMIGWLKGVSQTPFRFQEQGYEPLTPLMLRFDGTRDRGGVALFYRATQTASYLALPESSRPRLLNLHFSQPHPLPAMIRLLPRQTQTYLRIEDLRAPADAKVHPARLEQCKRELVSKHPDGILVGKLFLQPEGAALFIDKMEIEWAVAGIELGFEYILGLPSGSLSYKGELKSIGKIPKRTSFRPLAGMQKSIFARKEWETLDQAERAYEEAKEGDRLTAAIVERRLIAWLRQVAVDRFGGNVPTSSRTRGQVLNRDYIRRNNRQLRSLLQPGVRHLIPAGMRGAPRKELIAFLSQSSRETAEEIEDLIDSWLSLQGEQ